MSDVIQIDVSEDSNAFKVVKCLLQLSQRACRYISYNVPVMGIPVDQVSLEVVAYQVNLLIKTTDTACH